MARPDMVRVGPGSFVAGSSASETVDVAPANAAREQPQWTVTLAAFGIQRTEVTRGDYAKFVRATGRQPDGGCGFLESGIWSIDQVHDWRRPGFAQTARHPVVCVDHGDAVAYAAWLSARTGRRFRLPSGDEWEYAARAGTTGMRWWGDAPPCASANVAGLDGGAVADPAKRFGCRDGFVVTAPVASFAANPWGLHDMLGNVWEWTLDCADAACTSHLDRGGSWVNSPKYLRAAARHPDLTGARTTVLGFRLVEDLR